MKSLRDDSCKETVAVFCCVGNSPRMLKEYAAEYLSALGFRGCVASPEEFLFDSITAISRCI